MFISERYSDLEALTKGWLWEYCSSHNDALKMTSKIALELSN